MSEHTTDGTVAVESSRGGCGYLVLLRHGQTVWSESGQHTGRTDIPLTPTGRQQAVDAGQRLREAFPRGFEPGCVFSSPLKRARQTAELAGFEGCGVLDGIAEWDYGRAEGRTRQQLSKAGGFEWDIWRDGPRSLPVELEGDWEETLPNGEQVHVHNGEGETLEQAAARAKGAIDEILPLITSGRNVLLVAHAHILRILTSQWLGVDPHFARLLRLDTAHYSVLSVYKGDHVIERWNA
ncbi:histidine phosphatase family protein [Bifidobacterium sp. LC6]|uniref:Histidine phosphatase family protein n=1 Tax=Bifidobacterium colobi TaxID=2809026 RepID=A0ABS5UXN0_9BIFI|nr:histidine phosphatase family protein [Bifidobacterium colobi]MBT1175825.1 histidine phosphatase family protein [Bifidobacterium colobi]